MGYWGWRPLIFLACISVWIEGCSYLQESTPPLSPTEYPPVTLTVRHPLAFTPTQGIGVSFVSTPLPLHTPNVVNTATSSLDEFPSLLLQSPTCYDSPTGGIICFGEIKNDSDTSVGLLEVQVQLLKADHTVVAERITAVEQRALPPGASAPYRAQFAAQELAQLEDNLFLTYSLVQRGAAPKDIFVPLIIEAENIALLEGRYAISATLYNPNEQAANAIRLVATLRDAGGRISGYRVVELNQSLEADARMPVVVTVMPQGATHDLIHHLYVEAQLNPK